MAQMGARIGMAGMMVNALCEAADAAHERARKSPYLMVAVSARRYAIVRSDSGVSAHGTPSNGMYGVRRGQIVASKLAFQDALDMMRRIDHEGFDPESEQV